MNLKDIIQPVYDRFIRPLLPVTTNIHTRANIPVPADEVDPIAPKALDIKQPDPEYKQNLLDAIETFVEDGDDVGVIGLGRGVSSVVSLRQGATVTGYEAAAEMIPIAEQTIDWQGYDERFESVHGVVGEPVKVYGEELGRTIPPHTLEHDTLIMDCEGSEASIIEGLDDGPELLIVETHPERGVPTDETLTAMRASGFRTVVRYGMSGKQIVVAERE